MTRPPGQKITSRTSTYPKPVQGIWTWLRSHPWEADLALAALVFLASLSQSGADPLIRVVSLVLAATLIVRRKYPVQAFIVAAVIVALQVWFGLRQPTAADIALAVLLYTLAAHAPRRISVGGLAACLILSAGAISRWGPAHGPDPGTSILAAATLL